MATGLIDVGIIKPELAGSFAAGYRGAEQARQKAGLVQQETEMNQMKLEQLKQDRASLLQLQNSLKAAGKDPNPIKVFDALIATGNPDYVMKGIDGKRRLAELQRADRMLRQYAPELFDAEPTNAMAPAAPAGASMFDMPAGAQPSGDYTSTQAMGRVPGVVTTPIPESPPVNAMALAAPVNATAPAAAPVNAMAPAAAPVNAMAPTAAPAAAPAAGSDVTALRRQLMTLSSIDDPRAKALAEVIKGQITEASKPYVVNGRLVTGGGRELYAAPDKPTELQRNYKFAKTPAGGNFKGSLADFKVLSTPRTNNILNAPIPKSLAAPVGARAEASLVKAEAATGMMENANMVRDALNSGNVIAGPLAGPRLKFQQILDVAGAGDKEKLIATRNAIQGLAAMTLEGRAELKGQGQVTENEQKLLERARSGNIEDMTVSELQTIVDTSQRLANRMWSNHQNLLGTMSTDPNAAESLRYYQPTSALPQAVGQNKPAAKAETDKRNAGLAQIFRSN